MNRRPTCDEAMPRGDGHDAPLVQIGLPTGARSTGFEATRRDVLSLMGFSLGAMGLGAGCRAPVQHAVPLPSASTEMVPGVPNLYATTCGGCGASCGLVVKQRDGRPIKIEGNEASPLTGGGTCAAGQAGVLSLYDDARLRGPVWLGNAVSWSEIDRHITTMLGGGGADRRAIVLLSPTINSPSTRAVLADFRARFPGFRHVVHDPMSLAALREANRLAFGAAVVPHFRFDRARVVVALEADFLGTWLAPVEFARQWARRRTADGTRGFHVQCEAGLSVTGSNADLRLAVAPSELGTVAVALLAAVARRVNDDAGLAALNATGLAQTAPHAADIDRVADALARHRGESLVVTGSDDVATQIVVGKLNALLGNIGARIADRSRAAVAAATGRRRGRARADRRHEPRRGERAHPLGRQPGLRSPGRPGVPQGARQGPADHLVRRSARRDQRPRPRALPRSPFPRIVGRRGAGERALQPGAAADRPAARHPRRRREPAGVGSVGK